MLMSPMLMFLGISGRFMFFTADTARAGAPAIPAYTHTKHPRGVEKIEISLRINTTHDHTQYVQQHNNAQNKVLTKRKSTDSYSDRKNVQSDAFIASNAHALFGSIMVYITTRANYDSTERTVLNQSLNLTYWKVRTLIKCAALFRSTRLFTSEGKMQGDNIIKQKIEVDLDMKTETVLG